MVLVVIDTLRADRLTQYGHGRDTSPAFAELAAQATRFASCYAPAPWTSPSTASIHSGLVPARHQSLDHGDQLSAEVETLAERLYAEGWTTAGFSLNHNVSEKLRFDQGFEVFEDVEHKVTAYADAEVLVERATDWIEGLDGLGEPNEPDEMGRRPFFLFLQPMNCHGPYRVPDGRRSALLGRAPDDSFRYFKGPMKAILKEGKLKRRAAVDEDYLTSLQEQYDTAVRYTTDQVAALFDELKARGLYDDALIVVTSDHGDEFFEHGGFGHGFSLHREVLHVPLFIKLPGQREGRTVTERVGLVDLYPTVLEVLGLEPPDGLDGDSLVELMRPPASGAAPGVDWERRVLSAQVLWDKRCTARSILAWPYKLIHIEDNYEGARDELRLYDLARDPGETDDLAPREPELAAELARLLEARFEAYASESLAIPDNVLDSMDEDVLRDLGYL